MWRLLWIPLCLAPLCPAADTARMDEVVNSYVSARQFMGSVLVARGGEVVFSKGYGSANLEWDLPNSPATRFRLGSITKQFTAAALLLLEEEGKLNLQDPVKKYLPDAPAAWEGITIFHLLTHTSGIPNFTGFPEYRKLQPFPMKPAEVVAVFRDRPLEFKPGERMKYSNSGYLLLGQLLEKISGQDYRKFLQERIFTPLGMKDSGYDSNEEIIPRRAAGYTPSPAGIRNTGFIHMSIPFSAGALYSTTGDLLRWQRGLFEGKLLRTASLEKMITPHKSNYALGLVVETRNGRKMISHGGGIEGFNTYLAYCPDERLTVAALANLNGGAPQSIAVKLVAVAVGEKVVLPSERKQITVAPAVLARYAGTYAGGGPDLVIRLEGDYLTAQLGAQPRLRLLPESETRFFLKEVDAQLEFTTDASGKATAVTFEQGPMRRSAERKSDAAVKP